MAIISVSFIKHSSPYAAMILLGGLLFSSAGRDDVHITYWASWVLKNYGEILNYSGQRVEQSSSLLHTLLLSPFLDIFGLEVATTGALFSIICAAVAISLHGRLSTLFGLPKIESQLVLATCTPFIYWAFGGLEATLVTILICGILIAYLDGENRESISDLGLLAVAVFLYLIARPESVFVLSAFFIMAILYKIRINLSLKKDIALLGITWIFFSGVAYFRFRYFGDVLPQPVAAKINSTAGYTANTIQGFEYIKTSVRQYPALLFFPLAAIFVRQRRESSSPRVILALFVGAYLSFVITSGGDWMEGARFIVPIMPLLIILGLVSVYRGGRKVFLVAVLANLACNVNFARSYSTGVFMLRECCEGVSQRQVVRKKEHYSMFELRNRVHFRDAAFIDAISPIVESYIKLEAGRKLRVLSGQAGMVAFYIFRNNFKHLEFIDAAGLATRDFTSCKRASWWGRGSGGVLFNYADYISHRFEFLGECNIPIPEIVFDIDDDERGRASLLEKNGYTIVYWQHGQLLGEMSFPGGYVSFNQFLAVRNDLFEKNLRTFDPHRD